MAQIHPSKAIEGVYIAELQSHGDERGRFTELYRKEWFPQRGWDAVQWSRSESQQGVLRGLHYHHRQVDYWHCGMGALRVGLLDLRCTARRLAGRGRLSSWIKRYCGASLFRRG